MHPPAVDHRDPPDVARHHGAGVPAVGADHGGVERLVAPEGRLCGVERVTTKGAEGGGDGGGDVLQGGELGVFPGRPEVVMGRGGGGR